MWALDFAINSVEYYHLFFFLNDVAVLFWLKFFLQVWPVKIRRSQLIKHLFYKHGRIGCLKLSSSSGFTSEQPVWLSGQGIKARMEIAVSSRLLSFSHQLKILIWIGAALPVAVCFKIGLEIILFCSSLFFVSLPDGLWHLERPLGCSYSWC